MGTGSLDSVIWGLRRVDEGLGQPSLRATRRTVKRAAVRRSVEQWLPGHVLGRGPLELVFPVLVELESALRGFLFLGVALARFLLSLADLVHAGLRWPDGPSGAFGSIVRGGIALRCDCSRASRSAFSWASRSLRYGGAERHPHSPCCRVLRTTGRVVVGLVGVGRRHGTHLVDGVRPSLRLALGIRLRVAGLGEAALISRGVVRVVLIAGRCGTRHSVRDVRASLRIPGRVGCLSVTTIASCFCPKRTSGALG